MLPNSIPTHVSFLQSTLYFFNKNAWESWLAGELKLRLIAPGRGYKAEWFIPEEALAPVHWPQVSYRASALLVCVPSLLCFRGMRAFTTSFFFFFLFAP